MFDWAIGGLGDLFGFVGDAAGQVVGWAWDKVIEGIYTWLANGLALLIEWVWSVLDAATTPRVTAGWFRNELAARVGLLALAVTIAMMLASAAQAALAGRPEQITDAIKSGVRAIVASALTLTVLDVLIGIVDEAARMVWQVGRPDLVTMLERIVVVATTTGPLGTTFVGPLCLLFGFLGLLGLVVALMMRSALIYVAAALAPIVWSVDVLPLFRGSARKLVHLTVALVVSKFAIVVTLVVAVKLLAHPAGDPTSTSIVNDGAAAVGTLMTGFACFLIAAVTPVVLYKLMPTVEGAIVGAGIAGGWARGATTTAHTALMAKSFGATAAMSAATRGVAGQGGVAGAAASTAASAAGGGAGGGGAAGSPAGFDLGAGLAATRRNAPTHGTGNAGETGGPDTTSSNSGPSAPAAASPSPASGTGSGVSPAESLPPSRGPAPASTRRLGGGDRDEERDGGDGP